MATLSISLSQDLAKASKEAAGKLGISRTQFIRQAISHELEHFQLQLEQAAIVRSIAAMKKSKTYLKEFEEIIGEFSMDFPEDGEEWWNKTKS
ncbi:MAG TPA: ribbon-helix-helix domain-containing protein [Gammaproteobacteria bacterium]|nr:ribbon-helix-helix domain-containing protein [Gammaproteobacteria bacterium]